MKTQKLTLLAAVASVVAVFSFTSAQAAIIWGTPATNAGTSSDIYAPAGATFFAGVTGCPTYANSGSYTDTTTGVVFKGDTSAAASGVFADSHITINNGGYPWHTGGGGTGLSGVFGGVEWEATVNDNVAMTISGLTSGHNYAVQMFAGGTSSYSMVLDPTAQVPSGANLTLLGAHNVVGTFTASGSTQSIAIGGLTNNPGVAYAAMFWAATQIQDITNVPEPQTWAMLLGGVGMLVGFRRMRRRH